MMLADTIHIEPDLIGELHFFDEIAETLSLNRGAFARTGLRDISKRVDPDFHSATPRGERVTDSRVARRAARDSA